MAIRKIAHLELPDGVSPEQAQQVLEQLLTQRTRKDAAVDTVNAGMFISTKTYGAERGFAVAYRQHKADSHCNLNHGYSLCFQFEFECNADDLSRENWSVDFGSFKTLKEVLDDNFDHTTLIAETDPELPFYQDMQSRGLCKLVVVPRVGCEGLAAMLAEYIMEWWMPENGFGDGRVRLRKVEVRETPSNSAMWMHPDAGKRIIRERD